MGPRPLAESRENSGASDGPSPVAAERVGRFAQTYVRLSTMTNPGCALRWGNALIPRSEALPYPEIRSRLQGLLRALGADPVPSLECRMLAQSVEKRIFELEKLGEWRFSPYYYAEKLIAGIGQVLMGPLRRVHGDDALLIWLRHLPTDLRAAEENLAWEDVPQLDGLFSARLLRRLIGELQSEPTFTDRLDGDAKARILQACEALAARLGSLPKSNPFVRTCGTSVIEEWIRLSSGVVVSAESLAERCKSFIEAGREDLLKSRRSSGGEAASPVDEPSRMRDTCERIVRKLAPWFDHPEDLLTGLEFRALLNAPGQDHPRAAYSGVPYVFHEPSPCVFFRTYAPRTRHELELDLVHEVFPGHHYERTLHRERYLGRLGCMTYESLAFIEGWATYCELFFARIARSRVHRESVDARLALIAFRALAALWIHGEMPWSDAMPRLQELTSLDESVVRSTLIDAYVSPWRLVSHLAGLLAIRKIAEGQDASRFHKRAMTLGPSILWEVEI